MALNVFCLTTIRAGIKPAIIVVTNKIPALRNEDGNVATNIPSEKGKLIGFEAKYGLIKRKVEIMPKNIPNAA